MGKCVPSREELVQLYVNEKFSLRELGKQFGVTHGTIWNWLKSYNIPRHESSPSGSDNPTWKGGTYTSRGKVYLRRPGHPRANSSGYVKRAIIVWEEANGHPFPKGKIAHHDNEIRDDDEPENIIPLTKSKHGKLHSERRRVQKLSEPDGDD